MNRVFTVTLAIAGLLTAAAIAEMHTSYIQSRLFSQLADQFGYRLQAQASDAIIFPDHGPYNFRQGYARLPAFSERLRNQDFHISHQSRFQPALLRYVEWGGHPPFHEKPSTGLTILDRDRSPVFSHHWPHNIYREFEEIPPLLVDTLLFIENRELLLGEFPTRNPAVEWKRLGDALVTHAANRVMADKPAPGASTLATQMEKYRYSPSGLTDSAGEKFRQMVSASARAYLDGPDTRQARQRIVRDYLNSTPLAGRPGYGEVHGLGDGLAVWYGMDFDRVNQVLSSPATDANLEEQARAFRAALSLLLSQRRPSHYLAQGRQGELGRLADSYLRLLAEAGVIPAALRDRGLTITLERSDAPPPRPELSFVDRKAVNSIRTRLLDLLGVEDLYTLDRLDLRVETTLDGQAQRAVTRVLQQLSEDPQLADKLGLMGYRLLKGDNLDRVRYSFLLYERTPLGNLLRVQADNYEGPFDINHGTKLDLGSTAKLRTLISYLEIVETLYQRHRDQPVDSLPAPGYPGQNPLYHWAVSYLRDYPEAGVKEMLGAAMARTYSADPGERFFTGGGLHRFRNFDRKDNSRNLSVAEAFKDSVNLAYIRLMRDIVRFHTEEIPGAREVLTDPGHPDRIDYLQRFADLEGRQYTERFYPLYAGLDEGERMARLAERTPAAPYRLAAAFRTVQPEAGPGPMAEFMRLRLGDQVPGANEVMRLYDRYHPDNYSSHDRAYIASIHPLELSLLAYLHRHPEAGLAQLQAAGGQARQEAYQWLFRTDRQRAQDRRIRIVLERDAFRAIHRQWQRLGYPFDALVPSYASALGASADRPSAMAELMGIILNDGIRLPPRHLEKLHFVEGTPYETVFEWGGGGGEKVLSPDISSSVRSALMDVVETGTGQRLSGAFLSEGGEPLAVGGKTGTADHRSKRFAPGGRLLESRVVNRNAVFSFFIGDSLFGTLVVHVEGEDAAAFNFTSALPAQLLKSLEPALRPLLRETGRAEAMYMARTE